MALTTAAWMGAKRADLWVALLACHSVAKTELLTVARKVVQLGVHSVDPLVDLKVDLLAAAMGERMA